MKFYLWNSIVAKYQKLKEHRRARKISKKLLILLDKGLSGCMEVVSNNHWKRIEIEGNSLRAAIELRELGTVMHSVVFN